MRSKLLLFIMAASLLVGCTTGATATALPTVAVNAPAVKPTSAAGITVGRGTPAASGVVVTEQDAQLGFTVNGTLKAINFKEGDQVQAGQVLAELNNDQNQRDLEQAKIKVQELTSPAAIAATEKALADDMQAQKDAQDKVNSQFYRRASDTLIQKTQSQIDLAKHQLSLAQDAYKLVAKLQRDDSRRAQALLNMSNAQMNLNDFISKYNWYIGKPTEIDIAQLTSKLDVAKTAVQQDQWYLSVLKGESVPADATGPNLAALKAAQSAVADAQQRLDNTRLVTPISGVIVKVNAIAGEITSPGQILFQISDVSHLHIETTDLSERDVPNVKIGQAVMVTVKALGSTITGKVTSISPVSDTIGGDVVYKTKIELDSLPEGLRAGMSVDVQYQTGP